MTSPARVAPPIANRLEMPLGEGVILRVDFDRAHDRWRHRVFLVVPEGSNIVGPVLLLESLEGKRGIVRAKPPVLISPAGRSLDPKTSVRSIALARALNRSPVTTDQPR